MFICTYRFFISVNNLDTKAYYEDLNGNIQSSNLANLDTLANLQAINSYSYLVNEQTLTINQYVSDNDPYIYFNDFITLNAGTYSMYYLVDTQQVQAFGLTQNNTQNFVYNIPYQNYSRFTINSTTTFGLGFEGNGLNGRTFNIKVMIYSENYQLSYEPYGKVWYSSQSNYSPLYKVLNGTTAKAFNYNETDLQSLLSATPTMTEVIDWGSNYGWSSGSIPNIQHAILDAHQGDPFYRVNRPIVLLTLNSPLILDNLTFYRIDNNQIRYIYLYFYDGSMESISIADSSDVSTKYVNWYNYNNKALTYIAFDCEPSYDMVTDISQPAYSMVYADGYDAGSTDGYKEGYQRGLNDGSNGGYQRGYDIGKQDGIIIGSNQSNTLYGMIIAVVDAPINIFKNIFNFDILGINIVSIVFGIITLLLIIYLIKKLL